MPYGSLVAKFYILKMFKRTESCYSTLDKKQSDILIKN